jgi:hypothetical protein
MLAVNYFFFFVVEEEKFHEAVVVHMAWATLNKRLKTPRKIQRPWKLKQMK